MKIVMIDCAEMTSRAAAHETIAKALDFPLYYGKNLDALADCLSELPRDTTVVLHNPDAARDALGEYADTMFGVFAEISQGGGFLLVAEDTVEADETE